MNETEFGKYRIIKDDQSKLILKDNPGKIYDLGSMITEIKSVCVENTSSNSTVKINFDLITFENGERYACFMNPSTGLYEISTEKTFLHIFSLTPNYSDEFIFFRQVKNQRNKYLNEI